MALYPFLKDRIPAAKALIGELRKSFEYVSILGSYTKSTRIVSGTRSTSVDETENECGFVIRTFDGKYYSEYSVNDIADLSAEEVKKKMELPQMHQEFVDVKAIQEEAMKKSFAREDAHPLSREEILSRLEEMRHYYENYDSRIIYANLVYRKQEVSKIFVSEKKCLDQYTCWVNAIVSLSVRENDILKDVYKTENEADSALALKELSERREEIAQLAIHMLEATPITPGEYDIITDPSITGLIAHEAFGHGVEMDMFVKHRAKSVNYLGKKVASDLVSMHDGASAALSQASYFFDDDGVLAHDTLIIKDGILQTGISDALSALQLGTEPTGNGRRESFKRKAYTRMTNTFFAPGKDKLEDMFASVKHGYYLCDTNNGMEDPKNWQIQCTAMYGLEIVDGKFSGKIVSPVVISGSVLDLLNSISMVSDEYKVIGSGSCGKGYKEWVLVSDGGPYLKARAKLG